MKKIDKNDPLLKYGGYASVMTAIVVVAVIVINLIVGSFNIKFDLTKNGLYTLSDDTVTLVENLKEDVNIYSLYAEGEELSMVTEILDRYASLSKHIKVTNVDPYTDPAFTSRYTKNGQQPTVGDLVVETSETFSVIPQEQITDISVDSTSQTAYIKGLKVESVLTGTIRQLTNGAAETIYELSGHGETPLGDGLKQEMTYGGFTVESLDLIKTQTIPDDCEILVINGLSTDLSQNEASQIKTFLENGGKAFISLTIKAQQTPNFDSLLAYYGIADSGRIVIEGSANYALDNNPLYILPQLNSDSNVCKSLINAGTNVFTPASVQIERLDTNRSTVDIEALASSSQYAYSKNIYSMNSGGVQQASDDPTGPLDVVVSITDVDNNGTENGTKLVVAGTPMLLEDDVNSMVNGGNFAFVMNSFDFLNGTETIGRSKSIGAEEYLNLTQGKGIIIIIISVIVIPLAILLAGLTVFIRRKNK